MTDWFAPRPTRQGRRGLASLLRRPGSASRAPGATTRERERMSPRSSGRAALDGNQLFFNYPSETASGKIAGDEA